MQAISGVSQLIAEVKAFLREGRRVYRASIYGERRPDGRWEAWLEFTDAKSGDRALTATETTQHDLRQLRRWASGLTPGYVEGAFARARRRYGRFAPAGLARRRPRRTTERS
ncbi:MAG TPA: hypothetical protein VFA01_08420 [Candidatus Dormibacteraeota bacterium]|jgi:hypothetical protein|nr:hypothetical protein [Candidatus Dormibacteraeota bacterium]